MLSQYFQFNLRIWLHYHCWSKIFVLVTINTLKLTVQGCSLWHYTFCENSADFSSCNPFCVCMLKKHKSVNEKQIKWPRPSHIIFQQINKGHFNSIEERGVLAVDLKCQHIFARIADLTFTPLKKWIEQPANVNIYNILNIVTNIYYKTPTFFFIMKNIDHLIICVTTIWRSAHVIMGRFDQQKWEEPIRPPTYLNVFISGLQSNVRWQQSTKHNMCDLGRPARSSFSLIQFCCIAPVW